MAGDLDVIDELEREVGTKIPRRSLDKKPSSRLMWSRENGCYTDKNGKAVAIVLVQAGLDTLPRPILRLENLMLLNLALNELTALPDEIAHLKSLKALQLYGNRIKCLPSSILELGLHIRAAPEPGHEGIVVEANPLESPPIEIIKQGMDAVRAYFASLEVEKRPLNEVKILFVGDGGAGKTCLVKRLLGQGFNPEELQTDGINIDPWSFSAGGEEVKLNLWDFGGQEIMHATHQFFLSERSVYVLVLDGRKEEDPEYWLKHVESFGGDSPILIVLNKMDENPGFDVNRRFLQGKYKGIVGFYNVSCRKGAGIPAFRKGLVEALGRVEIATTLWPANWFKVKERLEKMEEHFLSQEEYRKLCAAENVADKQGRDVLVQFLHDLGVVVHFPDLHLQDTHVLEPRWLTGAVYRIINSDILAKGHGVLKLASLGQILSSGANGFTYPTEKHPYIVELMKKFELCYQMDSNSILVPDLLEVQEPEIKFGYDACLRFRIDYDFLPRSIMPRFIVKKHRAIKGQLRWRTGVVLEDKTFKSVALVKADEAAKRIYVYICGEQARD